MIVTGITINDMAPPQRNTLAERLERYVTIVFPTGTRTFHLTDRCIATEISHDPQAFRSDTEPIMVYHSPEFLQLWARTPIPQRIRIVIVDYREVPRERTILGHIWFGTVPGDVEVSDYRVPLGAGIFPDIMRNGTVYILGVRFPNGNNQTIPLEIKMYDDINRLEFKENIELVHLAENQQFIRASAAISLRAQKQNKPQKSRYLPKSERTTKVTELPVAQVATPSCSSSSWTPTEASVHPLAAVRDSLPTPTNIDTARGAVRKTVTSISSGRKMPLPSTSKEVTAKVKCPFCDWQMPESCYERHVRLYHQVPCPICDEEVEHDDMKSHQINCHGTGVTKQTDGKSKRK